MSARHKSRNPCLLSGVIWWMVNEAQQVMRKILRVTDVVVQVNPTDRKWVILRESNVVRMSFGRSCCFFGTAQPGITSFMFCNLSDRILFVTSMVETLHKTMSKFSLVKI